jgi:hypothetical protein
VAKKQPSKIDKLVAEFVTDISTDAAKLASFIQDPGSFMEKAKIPTKARLRIRDELALIITKRLSRLMSFHEHH